MFIKHVVLVVVSLAILNLNQRYFVLADFELGGKVFSTDNVESSSQSSNSKSNTVLTPLSLGEILGNLFH